MPLAARLFILGLSISALVIAACEASPATLSVDVLPAEKPGGYDINLYAYDAQPTVQLEVSKLRMQDWDKKRRVVRATSFKLDQIRMQMGPPGPAQQIYLRIEINSQLLAPGFHGLIVRYSGTPSFTATSHYDTYIPKDDARKLNAYYRGRSAWLYGEQNVYCQTGPPWLEAVGKKYIIESITRDDRLATLIGPAYDAGFHYMTTRPLVVRFSERTACGYYYVMASDAWDLQRSISLTPPTRVLGRLHLGMTKQEVAFAIGFPPGSATRPELMAATEWHYPARAEGLETPLTLIFRKNILTTQIGHW